MAYVILKDASKSKWQGKDFESELKTFSRSKLPGFARPEWVEVVEALPKTSTGKIQKHGEDIDSVCSLARPQMCLCPIRSEQCFRTGFQRIHYAILMLMGPPPAIVLF